MCIQTVYYTHSRADLNGSADCQRRLLQPIDNASEKWRRWDPRFFPSASESGVQSGHMGNGFVLTGHVGNRLRKVAEPLATWPRLLGVEAEMVREAEHPFDHRPRVRHSSSVAASVGGLAPTILSSFGMCT
jgi:hypothetical protein